MTGLGREQWDCLDRRNAEAGVDPTWLSCLGPLSADAFVARQIGLGTFWLARIIHERSIPSPGAFNKQFIGETRLVGARGFGYLTARPSPWRKTFACREIFDFLAG
jgi:hypothetical protein